MKKDEIVVYRDSSRRFTDGCAIVVQQDCDDPDCVWIRWNGEMDTCKERITELMAV